jgi:hypothetical protein
MPASFSKEGNMTQFAQYIFAMLLAIISPGQSTYSRVALPTCDETCQKTLLCSNPNDWRCKAPQFNQQLYEEHLAQLRKQGMPVDKAMAQARLMSFTRPETYQEGLVRYAVIAQAIADVSEETTQHLCKQTCNEESTSAHNACVGADKDQCIAQADADAKSCHQQCIKNAPWLWSRADLAFMIATVTDQESGFRADVHGGTGTLGRGDCEWKFSDGRKAAPFAKGAAPVAGTCRSVCLGQINIGTGKTPGGWSADDLVGLDYQSTKRCVTAVARVLSRSRTLCTRWNRGSGDWSKATFAAYGTGASCVAYQRRTIKKDGKRIVQYAYRVKKDNGKPGVEWAAFPPDNALSKTPMEAGWPARRSSIFQSYMRLYMKKALVIPSNVQQDLAEPRVKDAIQLLMGSSQQVTWMAPLPPKPAAKKPDPSLQAKEETQPVETAQK